jgi:hypothetical protein
MPDGQNQGPDVASQASTADPAARQPIFESLDSAPGGGEDVAGLFATAAGFAGDAGLDGAGPGQTMPIAGELWP